MKKILFLIVVLSTLALPQSSKFLLLMGDGYKNPETTLYLAGQTVSGTQATRIDNFITMLKDSLSITALSSKFDVMYLLANESAALGLRNLVKRSHDATAVNSPTFTQWEGFAGNGSTSYLSTNCNPRTQGKNYTQDNASFGLYCRTNILTDGKFLMGAAAYSANSGMSEVTIRAANIQTRLNAFAGNGAWLHSGNIAGMILKTRPNSTQHLLYFNGLLKETTSSTSEAIYSGNFYILGSVASSYSTNQVAFAFMGASLSATEVRKVTNCIEVYMDSLNKGVIP